MIGTLLEPFSYTYMVNAMWVSAMVGGVCAFLSVYLMLKGWSLIGDALSHSVVPGVAGAFLLGLPFSLGAFLAGGLAAASMLFLSERSGLKVDVVVGLIFTAFFGLGLFMISVNPVSVDVKAITMGNVLAVSPGDLLQQSHVGVVEEQRGVGQVDHHLAGVLGLGQHLPQRSRFHRCVSPSFGVQ